ncbi:hypothetical protein [Sphingomonas bacterium]|uniref:hypothetical protein n=1 Tax=Sphingomonas bacterium TaxID=1895847 RepID=UPI00157714CC|nr:hypothetical protein [Sphingomonas bacterium]
MNQTSPIQTGASPTATTLSSGSDFTSLLTNVHLIWIAILAAVVIAGIVYGARLKRQRRRAERQVVDHARQAGVEAPSASEDAVSPPVGVIDSEAASGSVTQLKGLGPKVANRLAELGITNVGQLAALDHDAALRLDADLGTFSGRMERDRWVEQARFLAAGDVQGFEAVFGRL